MKKKTNSKSDKVSVTPKDYGPYITIKKIPLDKAMVLLNEAGINVTEAEAEEIMEFLYTLTKITLKEFFSPT